MSVEAVPMPWCCCYCLLLLHCVQLFVLDGTKATAHYNYLQDLANLNMPAGE